MSYLKFKDISYAQGLYNMSTNTDPIIVMKMSGAYTSSKVLYYDAQAARNYKNAAAAKKAIGMYHFAGGGNPVTEADFFVKACSPLANGDVLILDWEIPPSYISRTDKNPVHWVLDFVNEVHAKTGVWPLVYMNISTANAYDWSPVFKNCGFWCAAPSYSFTAALPVKYSVVAQQGPIVGGVDTDAWFGTLTQFKAYGYKAPVATTTTVAAPHPTPIPTAAPTPVVQPTPTPPPAPTPAPDSPELTLAKENNGLLKQILALLQGLVDKITSIFK